jgi:hypothetical protein
MAGNNRHKLITEFNVGLYLLGMEGMSVGYQIKRNQLPPYRVHPSTH